MVPGDLWKEQELQTIKMISYQTYTIGSFGDQ